MTPSKRAQKALEGKASLSICIYKPTSRGNQPQGVRDLWSGSSKQVTFQVGQRVLKTPFFWWNWLRNAVWNHVSVHESWEALIRQPVLAGADVFHVASITVSKDHVYGNWLQVVAHIFELGNAMYVTQMETPYGVVADGRMSSHKRWVIVDQQWGRCCKIWCCVEPDMSWWITVNTGQYSKMYKSVKESANGPLPYGSILEKIFLSPSSPPKMEQSQQKNRNWHCFNL